MSEARDLRNQSRDFETVGNQWLFNRGMNAWALELFVESRWDAIEELIVGGRIPRELEKDLTLTFNYRGMTITIDPSIGLAAWDRPTIEPEKADSKIQEEAL